VRAQSRRLNTELVIARWDDLLRVAASVHSGHATVALVGGGLGNAVLLSIGTALRAAGSRVVYFAGYKKIIDRYKVEEIEKAADIIASSLK